MNFEEEYAQAKTKGSPYDVSIQRAAEAHGVSYDFLHKQLFMESRFNPKAKSKTGPRGLGQFTTTTGKAYGLETDEDFFDPEKSIDAAARHLKDNLTASNGDYLEAALLYNQGGGRLGRPQIAALKEGKLDQISEEGRKYMANLQDVAGDSPFKVMLQGPGHGVSNPGITPKSDAVSFAQATDGVTSSLKTQRGATPQLGDMAVKGSAVEPTRQTFAEFQDITKKAPQGWFEGTGKAVEAELATSTLGQLFRNVTMETVDPMEGYETHDTSAWGGDEFDKIRKAGVNSQFYNFLFDQTRGDKGRLDSAIKMALENQKYQQQTRGASGSAQVLAGFIGAGADPFTYMPLPGVTGTKLFSKVLQGAAGAGVASMASEGLREASTGMEAHYGTALVGGALVGGGLTALVDRIAARAVPNQRLDMWDGDLEKYLAMHNEGALPNEFHGPSVRLESRETARQGGFEDPTKMHWQAHEKVESLHGIDFVRVPGEPGAVRLADGSILSDGNPLNPLTIQSFKDAERAAQGVSMGGFTEIGYTLTRSENEEIRGIGAQLFRSTTGTESGSHGKFGAVASDIVERIGGQDHVTYNTVVDAMHEAIKDVRYANMPGGRQAHFDELGRRVVNALEDRSGAALKNLTSAERVLADHLNGHFTGKMDMLQNPAQFGNPRATSVLSGSRHEGFYFPHVYDDAAKNLVLKALLGDKEAFQQAIAQSMLTTYGRPHVKARVDAMIAEANPGKKLTPHQLADAVEEYARNKAYGISHTQDFNRSHLVDDQVTGLVGAENNNFLEGRHLFESDGEVTLPNGDTFSLNDLRSYDVQSIMPSYDRRVNGDIGIMGATGETTEALKDRITALGVGMENKKEYKALQDGLKILTGRARRDPDGVFATLARSLSDLSFLAKNAYMGIQGITETAALVTKGHTRMLLKGVPFFKEIATMGSKASPKFLDDMHGLVFGRELDDLIRPKRSDIIMRLRDNADAPPMVAKAVGTLKYMTQEASARWPLTKFLTESSNYIADVGRQGILRELVDFAHGSPTKMGKKLFDQQRLKSMSLTPEQFEGIQDLVREATVVRNGKLEIVKPELFKSDPRSMDIWRLGDKIADETILRPHKLSSQDTVAHGAGIKLAMQFKSFNMRSVNARTVRGYHDATKNGRAVDQVMQAILSTGMAGAMFAAMAYTRSVGMPDKDREKYLKDALNPTMLAYAALSRGSHIGAPLGLANMIMAPLGHDQARMVRTSITPRPKAEKQSGAIKYGASKDGRVQDFMSGVLDQVPGASWALSAGQAGHSLAGLAGSNGRRQDQEYMTSLYNGLRGIIPNDPASQFLLMKIMEEQGIEAR
ncbi:DNA translocation protein [Pseudomonas phage 67PfluR64PP]|uniref:DNA translocation protein n=1 Tax=Pseudomonas phage 67PfluR64PP TaxID=2163980 RepID=A0A2S1PGV2_9CAUD|nr:DNA translocation protein [Pseudomonas phage 67PfluR64PP]